MITALAVTGCVSTRIQTDWRAPGFQGTFRSVMVICVAQEPIVRETLENDLKALLNSRGLAAVSSHTLFPISNGLNRDVIRRTAREGGMDGVLLLKPVSHEVTVYGSYDEMLNYYNMPEQQVSAEYFRVQSALYEVSSEKPVWQALSDTLVAGAWTDTLEKLARVLGSKLIEHKLI